MKNEVKQSECELFVAFSGGERRSIDLRRDLGIEFKKMPMMPKASLKHSPGLST